MVKETYTSVVRRQRSLPAATKGEKSLTTKYGLVPESPDILHCEKAIFTGYIAS